MWGDNLLYWNDLLGSFVIYRGGDGGKPKDDGWYSMDDYINRVEKTLIKINGRTYDPNTPADRNRLIEAIIEYMDVFCRIKLFERRRQFFPVRLDYRQTDFGKRVSNWISPKGPYLRKKIFFFLVICWFRGKKYWWIIAALATGWVLVNAIRFAGLAFDTLAEWGTFAISVLVVVFVVVKLAISSILK